MRRLIDANALVPYLWALFKFFGSIPCTEADKATQRGIRKCIGEIEKMPTVDAVEVVRCKDCKHGIWDEEEQMWECILTVDLTGDTDTYAMFHEYNDGEHFCSYGKRKGDGDG